MHLFFYKDDNIIAEHNLNYKIQKMIVHTHTVAELYYFISGDCTFHIEGSIYKLQPGDLLIMRPTESHYAELKGDQPYERIIINFNTDMFTAFDPENVLMKPLFQRKSGQKNLYRLPESDTFFKDLLYSLKDVPNNELKGLNVQSRLFAVLLKMNELFQANNLDIPTDKSEAYAIIRYVNKNLSSPLKLDDIASHFYISKSQLCRIFKLATGSSVWNYITTKRLLAIKKELDEGAHPTSVFQKYGYQDYSTFYRAFVKFFGSSPKNKSH